MTKLTKETKKKAESLKINQFVKNNDFVFPLTSYDSPTVKELREFLSEFDDSEVVYFDSMCSNDYYSGGDAILDYANLLVRKTEELSEEEVLKLIASAEKKKAKDLAANKKRKETAAKNKEKRIKELEEELEQLKSGGKKK